ncbi:hypothetical protein PENTCL1PPCAC_30638, partial [Pristionchus entomophagus]
SVGGVIFNILLLYAIRRFTRKSLGSYKQLLTIFASYDIFLTILHAEVKPRVIIVGTYFGVAADYESRRLTAFYASCFTVPFTLMNIHFLYRFWSIKSPEKLALCIIFNCLLLYAIRRFTRKSLGAYKHLLTIFAAFDVFLTILHAAVKPRVTSFYASCFTVPFTLMNIHFLFRFWSIRRPDLLPLFSVKKFIALMAFFPVAEFVIWYVLCYYVLTGEGSEIGKDLVSEEYGRRWGTEHREGWLMMTHWDGHVFNLRIFSAMCGFDAIMIVCFSIASALGALTFYYIQRADKFSHQTINLQFKLFIAVCAQTFVPLVFVYVPYFCVITFPFFRLPIFFWDDACMLLTACFPAWDAVIMILLMKDYRDGLRSLITRRATVKTATSVWKTNTTQGIKFGNTTISLASSLPRR